MVNFKSTTEILNLVFSGETLNTVQSTAECFNAVYSADDNALKVNVIGGGGGGDGTSGTSGIDGATGEDGEAGTSGTSGLDGSGGDLSAISDTAILFNNAGDISGTTKFTYDPVLNKLKVDGHINVSNKIETGDYYYDIGYGNNVAGVNGVNKPCYGIGTGNNVSGYNNFAFGMSNTNSGNGGGLTFGNGNIVTISVNCAYGTQNIINGGQWNIATGMKNTITSSVSNAYNTIYGYNNKMIGLSERNTILGDNNEISGGKKSLIVSKGSTSSCNDITILGGSGATISDTTGTTWINPQGSYSGYTSGDTIIDGDTYILNDVEISGDPIITDTVTGTKYRIQVTSGVLGVVAI